MKYGESLQQRSIPLWENYNVDYNDLKRLIKVRTTHNQGQAKAIPGSDNEAKQLQEFECELYRELSEQHQRIDLFVQSKAGEIARRLSHLDKQIARLQIRTFASSQGKIPIKRLEKFSKAEAATLKAGEEIQFLAQFVGAQSLAFQKLLKKYKKWTGSANLGNRFREEVLDRPMSFSKRDFQPLLAQWAEVLAYVRAPFENGAGFHHDFSNARNTSAKSDGSVRRASSGQEAGDSSTKTSSSAAQLHLTWQSGSNVDKDTALAVLPLGSDATRAVYWIHSDNIVQIHVLLLRHTRLQRSIHQGTPLETPPSSRSSPRGSVSANGSKRCDGKDEEIGIILCDDIQGFAKRRKSETVHDSEARPGTIPEKAAASIRYTCNGEVIVAVGTIPEGAVPSAQTRMKQALSTAKFDRKIIHKLFNAPQTDRCELKPSSQYQKRVCDWLAEHQEVQPLVQVQARRTRFVGLNNNNTGGVWATLDRDILMRSVSRDSLARGKILNTFPESREADSKPFPHAILEVRVEGDNGKGLIAELDESHLTERVRGFSLEAHAVATLYKPCGMPRPFWLPALEQDIRKVPANTDSIKGRTSNGHIGSEQSSTRHTSISASSTINAPPGSSFSVVQGESSVTSAPDTVASPLLKSTKKKRKPSDRRGVLEKSLREPSQKRKQQHYWNEFDDGSEGSENEAYTIFVDPNVSNSLPGAATISKFFDSINTGIYTAKEKVASWFRSVRVPDRCEDEFLVNGNHSPSTEDSDLSDDDPSFGVLKPAARRRYSTFPTLPLSPAVRARETLLFRSCLTSFGASFVLLVIAAILKITGRRKAEATVDAGVIIGVAASLVFAIIAIGSMVGRKEDVGWVHRSVVLLVFVCVIGGSVALLAALGQGTR